MMEYIPEDNSEQILRNVFVTVIPGSRVLVDRLIEQSASQ
jgi:hypothetical protein